MLHHIYLETPFHPHLELLQLQQVISLKELLVLMLFLMQVEEEAARRAVERRLETVSKLAEFSYHQCLPGPLGIKSKF